MSDDCDRPKGLMFKSRGPGRNCFLPVCVLGPDGEENLTAGGWFYSLLRERENGRAGEAELNSLAGKRPRRLNS